MTTNASGLIKAIQTGRRKLGLSDEEYRALLEDISGTNSTKAFNPYQLKKVLRCLREAGFHTAIAPQLRKIRSLWFSMYDEGIINSKTEQSISAYIRRITKKSINTCDTKTFSALSKR